MIIDNNLPTKYKRGLLFSDIHFGRKSNSPIHNQDCLNFIQFLVDFVKHDQSIDYIAFLGDWNENRNAINISTLNFSYQGAKLLNDLNIPIFLIVGNHDLFYRNSRDVHSVIPFNEFTNFVIIDQPTIVKDIENDTLFVPFMFQSEYPQLKQYSNIPVWAGHFEFRGFVVTGQNVTLQHGADHGEFDQPVRILSGHFHKRQTSENVTYIGNTFPMDFSDAGDNQRGFAIYDHTTNQLQFHDWQQCPKYLKINLSDLVDQLETITFPENCRINVTIDIEIQYEQSVAIRQQLIDKFKLRELTYQPSSEIADTISETEFTVLEENIDNQQSQHTNLSIDQLVSKMITTINSGLIDKQLLLKIYSDIQ